jgi:hypothetical protein
MASTLAGLESSGFSRAVRDVLSNSYHDRWTGRGGPTAWPPRSPDMNPLDLVVLCEMFSVTAIMTDG